MKLDQEAILEQLNLVYRLKEQAETLEHRTRHMLKGLRNILEADNPANLYQRMFSHFHLLLPYDVCMVLEQDKPGFMQCRATTMQAVAGSSWEVGDIIKRVLHGHSVALFNINIHPDAQSLPFLKQAGLTSLLLSPFQVNEVDAVLVFAHKDIGFYTQEHVQIADEHRAFIEQALLSVNARLLAMESEQLRLDKERAEHSLLLSEKMASVGLLAAGVAHEINNPVGFISSNISYLKQFVPELETFTALLTAMFEAQTEEARDVALKACKNWYEENRFPHLIDDIRDICDESDEGLKRVADITTSLKSFTRADSGSDDGTFDVNQCIEDTMPLVHPELKHHVATQLTLTDVPEVCGSPRKLSQVLINLLVNAGQAIKQNGHITISTRSVIEEAQELVVIKITDDGCGIPPAHLETIFQPFYTTKPVGEGTGLGLYISLTIIESLGGQIWVESKLNRGTTFTIQLPAAHSFLATQS